MAWELTPYTVFFAIVAVAMLVISALSYRHRYTSGARPLVLLTLLTAVWAGSYAFQLAWTDIGLARVFANTAYVAIAFLPVVLLYFAVDYTGYDVPLTNYGPVPLVVVPAITQVMVWTNPIHGLVWAKREFVRTGVVSTFTADFGAWFWVHSAYSYGLTLLSAYLLVRMILVSDDLFRSQSVTILVGAIAPLAVNAIFLSGLVPTPVDPTPAAFSLTAVMFLVAIYRHKLLELVPVAREVARDELMNNLVEAVFILDDRGHVSDMNRRAEQVVGREKAEMLGDPLAEVVPDLASAIEAADEETDIPDVTRTDLALRHNGTLRHYDVRVTELHRGRGLLAGHLVSLRDVTERRQREQRLDVLNRALRHDLRNEANVILGYAELGMQNHPDAEWVQAIQEHVSGMVDLSQKVRQLEQALDGKDIDHRTVDVAAIVRDVVADIEHEHPDLDITMDVPETMYVSAIELVDSAIENALENAVEHNDNPMPLTEVSVSVEQTGDGDVTIEVVDNGPGIHEDEREVLLRGRETQLEHISGLGLWIINWIVTESSGTIALEENEPRGSIVTIRLPEADAPADAASGEETTTEGAPAQADGAGIR